MLFSVARILCPFALMCFVGSKSNKCPKACECYQLFEDTSSAICGITTGKEIANHTFHTLAFANITFDDLVLFDYDLKLIHFQHLVIESCGGTPQVATDRTKRIKSRTRNLPIDVDHTSLVISNSKHVFDWRWTNFNFRYIQISNTKLFSFFEPFLTRDFVDKVVGTNVRSLTISECKLTSIEDGAFAKLDKIRYLQLKKNKLKEIRSIIFANIHPKLWHIDLSGNNIDKISSDLFQRFPNLKEINLADNKLINLEWAMVKPIWFHLNQIDLRGNPLNCRSICWALDERTFPHPNLVDETECFYRKKSANLYKVKADKVDCYEINF